MLRVIAAFALALWALPAHAAPSAPAFTLKLLGGGTLDSRSLIGKKVVLIRFQASWCKLCAQEAPMLERIWLKYQPAGVEVVGVQVQDTEADARRFLKGSTYPSGLDPQLTIANRFRAEGTPYTLIINKRGEIVARMAGRTGEAKLARTLDPLVKEPARRPPPTRLQ